MIRQVQVNFCLQSAAGDQTKVITMYFVRGLGPFRPRFILQCFVSFCNASDVFCGVSESFCTAAR